MMKQVPPLKKLCTATGYKQEDLDLVKRRRITSFPNGPNHQLFDLQAAPAQRPFAPVLVVTCSPWR